MSQQSPHNSKRRPPAGSGADERQDADWGFDAAADAGVEKKLAAVLVVCLLAGFSFVLYQKFRILQSEEAHAQNSDAELLAAASPADRPVEEGDVAPHETRNAPPKPAAAANPFYEAPLEPSAARSADGSWTLTQAEQSEMRSTVPAPAALPAMPAEDGGDSFDPFNPPVDAAPSPPAPDGVPAELPEIVWDDVPASAASSPLAPPQQTEPAPFPSDEPQMAIVATQQEPSPFQLDPPTQAGEPSPADSPPPVDEPAQLRFDAVEIQTPEGTDPPPSFPPPRPLEPQQLDPSPPALSAAPASRSAAPSATTNEDAAPAGFDPFAFAEPSTTRTPSRPQNTKASPDPVPSLPIEEATAKPDPVAANEPPDWPFDAPAVQTDAAADPSRQRASAVAEESPMLTFDAPPALPEAAQWPRSALVTEPSNPFTLDSSPARPIVDSLVASQAVIGEREIIVTPSDNFWSISEREYGTSRYFTALARYNREQVPQAEALRAGMRIRVPPPEVLESQFPELFRNPQRRDDQIAPVNGSTPSAWTSPEGGFVDEASQRRYRVQQHDTLSSIAEKHLGSASRWTQIYDLNRDRLDSPSTLRIGMVLKLPTNAGRTPVSPPDAFDR